MLNSAHNQPGRRIAAGSNRDDHILALFGLSAHAAFFLALGAGACWLWPDYTHWVCLINAGIAGVLLVIRGAQVGLTTTKESIEAIKQAWM